MQTISTTSATGMNAVAGTCNRRALGRPIFVKSIGSRFARWSADYLHRASKALVREAIENDCTVIAFENTALPELRRECPFLNERPPGASREGMNRRTPVQTIT